MNKIITILVLGTLFLTSCKKLENPTGSEPTNPSKVTKFSEIKTDPTFNWSTVKEVTASIKGLKTSSKVRASLQLASTDSKSLFYIGNHLMEEDLNLKIRIPANVKEIKLSFGSVNKTYTVSGNKIDMDYVVDFPVEGE